MDSDLYLRGKPSSVQLARYPNWVNAGLEGEHEDVLTVEGQQDFISHCTELTSANATLADGSVCDAYLDLLPDFVVQRIGVFDGSRWWALYSPNYDGKSWKIARPDDWISSSQDSKHVSMFDRSIFPLTVVSRLPKESDCEKIAFVIRRWTGRSKALLR